MSTTKGSHVAIHSIQYQNPNKTDPKHPGEVVEVKAGSLFNPNDADVESLMKAGAIRKATSKDHGETDTSGEGRAPGPTGYADNTGSAVGTYAEPKSGDLSSADSQENLPKSRSTK